jgi:hypothetical protein
MELSGEKDMLAVRRASGERRPILLDLRTRPAARRRNVIRRGAASRDKP